MIWFVWVLWYINYSRLFNAKSCLNMHIEYIYDLSAHFVDDIVKQSWALFCKQLNIFNYCYITVTIQISVICLHIVCSIWPIDRTLPGATTPGPGQWQWRGIQHSPNLQGWSLPIRFFNFLSKLLVRGCLSPLQRSCQYIIHPQPTWL